MQPNTQNRVGYGQGRAPTTEVVATTVRIRHGITVQRGQYVGRQGTPVAFVWQDEEIATPSREVVIRVDGGKGCLWESLHSIVLTTAFQGNKEAARLVRPFEDWQHFFEKYYDKRLPQRFFWGRYHEEGLKLARRLQAAVIDDAVVRYQRPVEDPQSSWIQEIEL